MPSRNPGPLMMEKQEAVAEIERRLLLKYLKLADYNVSLASAKSGMLRSAFQRMLRKNGLDVTRLRREWRDKQIEAVRREEAAR